MMGITIAGIRQGACGKETVEGAESLFANVQCSSAQQNGRRQIKIDHSRYRTLPYAGVAENTLLDGVRKQSIQHLMRD